MTPKALTLDPEERAAILSRNIVQAVESVRTHRVPVRTREVYPSEWADTQNELAHSYQKRIRGKFADNMEKAIALNEATLTVFTHDAFPREWARVQNNLGAAYRRRPQVEQLTFLGCRPALRAVSA